MLKWVRESARIKRGGKLERMSMDTESLNALDALFASETTSPEQIFDMAWHHDVLTRAVRRLRSELCALGKDTTFDVFKRYDLDGGSAVEHRFGTAGSPGQPGEAVFVPSTNGPADENSGWYLGYVYDPARDGSDLVIIDAADFAAQPVARIKLPQRVPHGFHGNWIVGG